MFLLAVCEDSYADCSDLAVYSKSPSATIAFDLDYVCDFMFLSSERKIRNVLFAI